MENERIPVDGRKLYDLRSRAGLTLQQAADRIGIHKSTLCRYEQEEKCSLTRDMLERIGELYEIRPQALEYREKEADTGWYRILTPEEAARAYASLCERDRLRISRLLQESSRLTSCHDMM